MKKKAKKDTGWTMLKKQCAHNFERWGVWMKRAQLAEIKVKELEEKILNLEMQIDCLERRNGRK